MEVETEIKKCKQCNTYKTIKWYSGPICRKCYSKNYYIKNRKELIEKQNSKEVKLRRYITGTKYIRHRYTNDLNYRLKHILRSRLYKAIKNNYKTGSAVNDLGCSIEELKVHLESKFQDGMTWDNQGKWHIDHIMPLASFDLTDKNQLEEACHYTNLQPLWQFDNLSKGSKIEVK